MSAKKKHGGARPGSGRKPVAPEVRKDVGLMCYVSESEAESIRCAAEKVGISVSDYLRLRALGRRIPASD
jgi:hypothetical protein